MIWELIGVVGVFLVAYGILEMISGVREMEMHLLSGSRKRRGRL